MEYSKEVKIMYRNGIRKIASRIAANAVTKKGERKLFRIPFQEILTGDLISDFSCGMEVALIMNLLGLWPFSGIIYPVTSSSEQDDRNNKYDYEKNPGKRGTVRHVLIHKERLI